jgi:hypothetical protein
VSEQPPAVVAPEVERGNFVETFVVRDGNQRVLVPTNAVANKAMMQINVAKLRKIFERCLKVYEDNPEMVPGPKEMKAMVEAADVIEDLGARAYGDNKGGKLGGLLEKLVYSATRGAAEGAGAGKGNAYEQKLARMKQVGRAAEKQAEAREAGIIEVEAQ